MRRFLERANLGGIGIAILIAGIGYLLRDAVPPDELKVLLGLSVVIASLTYCFVIEGIAISRLSTKIEIQIKGNPLVRRAAIQAVLLIGVSAFLYPRLQLFFMLDFLAFSVLTYFFVSSMFETHRLLRR